MLWTSSIKYIITFKGGTFISHAVVQLYLYYTALFNKTWPHALFMETYFLNKILNRLIYLGYWSTKHWKCKQDRSKSKYKFGGTKVCKAEEVRKYFLNPEIESFRLGFQIYRSSRSKMFFGAGTLKNFAMLEFPFL